MTGILLALAAAFVWGIGNVWVRLALQGMRPTTVSVFSLFIGLLLLFPLALILHWDDVTGITSGVILTIFFYGMANFLTGRFLNYSSISRIGLNKAIPIVASSPVFALTLAVIFLDESVNALIILGTVIVMGGIMLIVTERR
jgi:drug/metabolite transporter (DMT)-like permease